MIELYHCRDARSFRPLWALEELGLDYRLHLLPFPPRVRQADYLAVNPLGTIPLLIDGSTRMTESAAILEYLAVRYGPTPLAVDPTDDAYGAWLNWIHFGEASLTFPQTLILRYSRFEPEARRSQQVADDYTQWFLSRLRAIDRVLSDNDYMCANRFTMADISVGYALLLARLLKLQDNFSPHVADYWERLSARPEFLSANGKQRANA
ncbi:Glutathione S-transferase-like protein [Novosphingobium resinovorum]|uniref:Glutathione S-transferase-like protein n=1 Tax=Novosphingobium resinovorum TaxID=158500 RepID=A0A031JZD5_9SPHN|nr:MULTISPECIES: glutathione S-transferase family protein [Novosphingobium]EZP83106.1 Glutathione S-transferase-like protein [Novosphingobium resinovorum]